MTSHVHVPDDVFAQARRRCHRASWSSWSSPSPAIIASPRVLEALGDRRRGSAVVNGAEWLARAWPRPARRMSSSSIGAAPHVAGAGTLGVQPVLAHGKGGGLHGRWLCPHRRAAGRVHGAVGRRRQSRVRVAGCLSRAQPGDRADRAQGPSFQHRNAYQEIAHAPLFAAVTKFSAPVMTSRRTAAAVAPRVARRAGRARCGRPISISTGCRAMSSRLGQTARAAGRRTRAQLTHPGAPAGRRRSATSSAPRRR